MNEWSDWYPFPDPRKGEYLHAPFGPGIYQLRHKNTGRLILFGCGKNLAYRMSSLLPEPLGQGRRDNTSKPEYIREHLDDVEYRTLACCTKEEAMVEESRLLQAKENYEFGT